jgi:uncharacterized membrane protein YhaH (DUF805 family)
MTFQDSVKSGFEHYISMKGRASRSEYWYWVLFCLLCFMLADALDLALISFLEHTHFPKQYYSMLFTVSFTNATALLLFLPHTCVTIRRLHDTNRRGWWLLINIIPLGSLLILIFTCLKGTEGNNRFGDKPL